MAGIGPFQELIMMANYNLQEREGVQCNEAGTILTLERLRLTDSRLE